MVKKSKSIFYSVILGNTGDGIVTSDSEYSEDEEEEKEADKLMSRQLERLFNVYPWSFGQLTPQIDGFLSEIWNIPIEGVIRGLVAFHQKLELSLV